MGNIRDRILKLDIAETLKTCSLFLLALKRFWKIQNSRGNYTENVRNSNLYGIARDIIRDKEIIHGCCF